jgi:hypothetical protein
VPREDAPAEPTVEVPVDRAAPEPTQEMPQPQREMEFDPLKRAAEGFLDERPSRKASRSAGRGEKRAHRREERRQAKGEKRRRKEQRWELGAAPAEALVARLPTIKPVYAAILSGAIAGLAVVLLAIGASAGCEAVRGTSSCGGPVGLLATVALLAIEVMIGANLLKAWQISDPVSTSFLGVGVVTTIAMLLFLDQIDSPWMLLVIPFSTAAAFAGSWWITVRFVDEHPMSSEVDSERGEPAFVEKPAARPDEDSKA